MIFQNFPHTNIVKFYPNPLTTPPNYFKALGYLSLSNNNDLTLAELKKIDKLQVINFELESKSLDRASIVSVMQNCWIVNN